MHLMRFDVLRVKRMLQENGMTYKALGKRLGVTKGQVSHILVAGQMGRVKHLYRVARLCGCKMEDLLLPQQTRRRAA